MRMCVRACACVCVCVRMCVVFKHEQYCRDGRTHLTQQAIPISIRLVQEVGAVGRGDVAADGQESRMQLADVHARPGLVVDREDALHKEYKEKLLVQATLV